MTYRVSKQPNGLYTIHDISIFAKCKRGSVEYDESWMDSAVKNANVTEQFGYCPPIFVKHNSFDQLDATRKEDADGRLSKLRRQPVRCEGKMKPGIVADLTDLSKDTAEKIYQHKFSGRSIETLYPSTRQSIDGLALLGRTKPFFELAQGSEPVKQNFSAISRDGSDGQLVFQLMDDEPMETFMIPGQPPAPAQAPAHAPAPAPAAPAAGGADAILKQIFALIQPLVGGGAPAAPAPAAPAPAPHPAPAPAPSGPPPAARMQASEVELLQAQIEGLKNQVASFQAYSEESAGAAAEAAEAAAAAKAEADIVAVFKELTDGGKCFTEADVRAKIEKFGLEPFREYLLPTYIAAPVGAPPAQVNTRAAAQFAAANTDNDLAAFSALSEPLRAVAAKAAAEYDAEARKSRVFTTDNPRNVWIDAEVRAAQRNS